MLTRLDPGAVLELARDDLPRPLDVLNLIELRDERSYARYGLAVAPALFAVGGRLRWMGRLVRPLLGDPFAERLMVVRYPSHRRFLAMTVNPYYALINRLRERGVENFEASFTEPYEEPGRLADHGVLLVAQFGPDTELAGLCGLVEPQAGPLVYAAREVASIDVLRGSRPTDPHPLSHPQIACFGASEELELDLPALDGVTLALYRRADPRALLAKAR
jgi:uncharacterized protein (DUF1330 family)